MQENPFEGLKHWLLEALITNSDINCISTVNDSVSKKIRKCFRAYVKVKDYPTIVVVENDLKPILKGEKGYWCIEKKYYPMITVKDKDRYGFKSKPYVVWKKSDYRVEVGKQWLVSILENKEDV